MKAPHRDTVTAGAMGLLLAFAILTLWIRDARPLAVFQIGVLGLAVVRIIADIRSRRTPIWHPFLISMGGMIVIGLAQLISRRTVYPWDTLGAVLNWTTHLAIAYVLLQSLVNDSLRRRWLTVWALFGIGLSVLCTVQLFTSPGKVFWMFDSGYADLVLGPFVYHNRYAQFIELLMPVALYRALTERARAPLWLLGAGVMFAGVIASVSRGGVLLLMFEILLVLACAVRQKFVERRTLFVVAGQLAGVAIVWGTVAGWSGVVHRLITLDPLQDWRVSYFRSSLAMIRDHPLLGTGLSTWPVVYPQYALFDPGLFVNSAHSDWLQWACEGGFITLLLMAALVVCLARPVLRSVWGVGFLVVLVHGFIDYPMQDAAFASLVFAFAGAVAAANHCRATLTRRPIAHDSPYSTAASSTRY